MVLVLLLLLFVGFGATFGIWARKKSTAAILGSLVAAFFAVLMVAVDNGLFLREHPFDQFADFVGESSFLAVVALLCGAVGGSWACRERNLCLSTGKRVRFSVYGAVLDLIFCAMLIPAMSSKRERTPPSCANNLRQIGQALDLYESRYGQWPSVKGAGGLGSLVRLGFVQVENTSIYHCPDDHVRKLPIKGQALTEEALSYVYEPPHLTNAVEAGQVPVCWDKTGNHHGGLNVLFADGFMRSVSLQEWKALRGDGSE